MPQTSPERVAEDFLEWCVTKQASTAEAALALERYLGQVLADANLRTLMVSARAKSMDSIRGKLLRKTYRRPRSQLTDRVAARVIVYHAREVDDVAALLRSTLVVREKDSSDKRLALGLREFGYRSYHLVAAVAPGVAASPPLWSLRGQIFEVQIRSLLEHIWAEIEHDVVYKSGADWPKQLKRRFASIAGVLELLDHEFEQLTSAASDLVESTYQSLRQCVDGKRRLDVPCMCALLEIEYPDGLSFRRARALGSPFPPGSEQRLQLALRRGGIDTVGHLLRVLRSRRLRVGAQRYAYAEGIRRAEVSHLAILALVIGIRSPLVFKVFFPEFRSDSSLSAALARRR